MKYIIDNKMKTRVLLIALMISGVYSLSMAQSSDKEEMKTIFGNPDHKISNGGYAAFTVGYTQIGGQDVVTLGGRAGWLIDHHVTLGIKGTALTNSIYLSDYWPDDQGYYLVGGYGGFFIEPIIAPNFPIHVSFPIMIGGGGVALNYDTWHDQDWEYDSYEPYDWDSFFALEPGIEIELNLVRCMRLAFGASYLYTTDMHMAYVPKDLMRNFSGTMTLKIGVF
jgi:hypothetical protein